MSEPVRTCVGCRSRAPQSGLLRVVARDGAAVPDRRRLESGRGAYVHADVACVALAEKRRAFGRALRVSGPLDLRAVYAALPATADGPD